MGNSTTKFLKKYMMVIALVVVVCFFAVITEGIILKPQNINNLISQNGYVFILATGMLLCILTGGNIDLAVGSVVCFTGAIGALIMAQKLPFLLAVAAMLLVGLAIGAVQGYFIAWISVPPFIATLAGMYAFRGLSNVILGGYAVDISNEGFLKAFGGGADCYVPDFLNGGSLNMTCMIAGVIIAVIYVIMTLKGIADRKKLGISSEKPLGELIKTVIITVLILWLTYMLAQYKGIPSVLIWIMLILGIYAYITQYTAIGRYFYAVGGNEKATRLSGINTKMVYFIAYANMGLLAGLAGILTVARAKSAQPTYGQGYEMDAIASCFIGGASAYGGIGSVAGVIIGATLMGVINQGMSTMGLSQNYQKAVKGLVLLIAVLADVLSKKKKS